MYYEQLNPDDCMSYLICDPDSKIGVIIDPKLDYVEFYMNILKEKGIELRMVIDTHIHADHLSGSAALAKKTGCEYGMHGNTDVQCVTRRFKDGEWIHINGIDLEIVHTPGHTKDSICVIFEDKIFTGDFIFLDYGGGRNDLPTGNIDEHWESLRKMRKLPDYLIICPGHNYSESSTSTLWLQKKRNPYFKLKDKKAFRKFIGDNKPEAPPEWLENVVLGNKECVQDSEGIDIPSMDAVCQSVIKRSRSGYLLMSPEGLKERLKKKKDIVILDVRAPKEMKGAKPIEGSINIPLGGLSSSLDRIKKYRDKDIVIVCRTGYKSKIAAKILMKSGFNKIYVLQGGIQAYKKSI